MQYSVARELKEGRGQSWGAIVAAGIAATASVYSSNRAQHAQKTEADRERDRVKKAIKKERKEQNRITMSPVAQNSLGLTSSNVDTRAKTSSISSMGFGLIAIAIIALLFLRR